MKHKITWTDSTWNPVWGCYGKCSYCYAENIATRFARTVSEYEHDFLKGIGKTEDFNVDEVRRNLQLFIPQPLNYRLNTVFPKSAKLIFVNSMSDVAFWHDSWIQAVMLRINATPDKIFQILTKFPERLAKYQFPENVWLGLTVTNTMDFKNKFDTFRKITAGKHFVSFEPLFDDVKHIYNELKLIDWAIIGCQTGRNRRELDNDVVLRLIDKFKGFDIPVFVKQLYIDGKLVKNELPKEFDFREFPK